MNDLTGITRRFAAARHDRTVAVLEGFHAVKHAIRFDATIDSVVTHDAGALAELSGVLAPDVADFLATRAEVVTAELFATLSPTPPETGVIAIARRPVAGLQDRRLSDLTRPVVLLESPANLANIGAVIRVAAGAGAAGVLTTGVHDPWHPSALRGSAGLHYALPVCRTEEYALPGRALIAIDGAGEPLTNGSLPDNATFAFGSERSGLSSRLRNVADRVVSIPMEPGVSSLNLATAVAVILYNWRLGLAPRR